MPAPHHHSGMKKQRGAALMLMMVIVVMGAAAILVSSLTSSTLRSKRNEISANALAQAKDALIGRAVFDDNRPGSLPCPDLLTNIPGTNVPDDGAADLLSGNHCPSYVGRLPWKTLGLPDLRDSDGERLWYALSPSVRDDNSAQPINSDTPGQFNIAGNGATSNVVAIIFSPGAVLSSISQVRGSAGQNNAVNYLEGNNAINASSIATDIANSTYTIASTYTFTTNTSSSAYNDSALAITADQIFSLIEKRIAKETANCLQDYSAANLGRYPWPASLGPASSPPQYNDQSGTLFGRIPDAPFNNTFASSSSTMSKYWPSTAACNGVAGWWANWKELVFYSVANTYQPGGTTVPVSCSTCLKVDPPSTAADKKVVIIMAGKTQSGQARASNTDKATSTNYLEGSNATGNSTFAQNPRSANFNDTLQFK